MGRGGGGVHHGGGGHHGGGFHHSGGGGGGKGNPIVNGVMFGVMGVIFLLLTIIVPVVMVVNPAGDPCGPSDSINAREQVICKPPEDDLDEVWTAEVESKGEKYVKFYRAQPSKLTTTTRTKYYADYILTLSSEYADFSINVAKGLSVTADAWCTRGKCSKVKFYWMTDDQFQNNFDDNGDFYESSNYVSKDLEDYTSAYNTKPVLEKTVTGGPSFMHFVVLCKKEKDTVVHYNINLDYTVYDVSSLKAEDCTGECDFEDMSSNEIIIMDNDAYGKVDSQEDWFEASIHNNDIDWSAVLACAFIFGILTIICFILCFLYLYKILKKLGKLGKKVAKKVEKEEKKKAEANAVSMSATAEPAPVVAAQPVADPNYAAGQPYPGQPYPGQDPAYAAGPAYPGQM